MLLLLNATLLLTSYCCIYTVNGFLHFDNTTMKLIFEIINWYSTGKFQIKSNKYTYPIKANKRNSEAAVFCVHWEASGFSDFALLIQYENYIHSSIARFLSLPFVVWFLKIYFCLFFLMQRRHLADLYKTASLVSSLITTDNLVIVGVVVCSERPPIYFYVFIFILFLYLSIYLFISPQTAPWWSANLNFHFHFHFHFRFNPESDWVSMRSLPQNEALQSAVD